MAELPADVAPWLVPALQAFSVARATYLSLDEQADRIRLAAVGPFAPTHLSDELGGRPTPFRGLLARTLAELRRCDRVDRVGLEIGDGATVLHAGLDGGVHNGPRPGALRSHGPVDGVYLEVDLRPRLRDRMLGANAVQRWAVDHLFLPCPILTNGNAPFGFRGAWDFATEPDNGVPPGANATFRHGSVFGQLADHPRVRGVRLVVHGVQVALDRLPELGMPGLAGVVHGPPLALDRGRVVRDARFAKLLGALRPVVDDLRRRVAVRHPRRSGVLLFHVERDPPIAWDEIEAVIDAMDGVEAATDPSGQRHVQIVGRRPVMLRFVDGGLEVPAWRWIDPHTEARIFRLVRALGAGIADDACQPVLPSGRARV